MIKLSSTYLDIHEPILYHVIFVASNCSVFKKKKEDTILSREKFADVKIV